MFYSPNWLNEPLSHTHFNQRSPSLSPLSLALYRANRISVARRLRLWKSFESSYSMYIEQYWISWVFFYWSKNNVPLETQTFFLSIPLPSLIELDVKEANVNFFVRKQNFLINIDYGKSKRGSNDNMSFWLDRRCFEHRGISNEFFSEFYFSISHQF